MPKPGPAAEKGRAAEEIAARFLVRHKLRIIERNYRVRGGEIDLICEDGKSTVFVEVRFRRAQDFGGAGSSITAAKQARIILAARHWLMQRRDCDCRFDCVLMDALDEARIEWIRNAFDAK